MPSIFGLLALSAVIAIIIYNVGAKYWHRYRLSRQFPGPPGWPLLGNALMFAGMESDELIRHSLQFIVDYGKTYRFWIGPILNMVMQDIRDVELILSSQTLIAKADEYNFLRVWLRDGLLLSTGRKWQQRRRLITPAFHYNTLEQFVTVFQRQTLTLVAQLQRQADGGAFEMLPYVSRRTLDIICEAAMGVRVHAQTNADSEYVRAVQTISKVLHRRMSDLKYRFGLIYKFTTLAREGQRALDILHGFTKRVIMQRRAELLKTQQQKLSNDHESCESPLAPRSELSTQRKMAFLDILLQSHVDGKPLTNLDICEEVDTFMFEGHDTTASAVNFLFYNIARHPECQRKCYEEIVSIFGAHSMEQVTCEQLHQMHYTELCIKETLRMYPPVAMIARKVHEDFEINGRIVPAGTNLGISAYQLGRQEELFDEPNIFKPERFDDVLYSDIKRSHFAYIPFSAGSRNCIGQRFAMYEMKTVMANVLRHYELEFVGDTTAEPVLAFALILRSRDPLMFKIRNRV